LALVALQRINLAQSMVASLDLAATWLTAAVLRLVTVAQRELMSPVKATPAAMQVVVVSRMVTPAVAELVLQAALQQMTAPVLVVLVSSHLLLARLLTMVVAVGVVFS
jgi:hypothetical protein